ncbi:uncharacterized protein LOC144655586 [Oculina patagonica]
MNGKELKDGDLNQTISLEVDRKGEKFNMLLYFSKVNIKHVGNFTCEATNKYHTTKRDIQVLITCPPELFKLKALPHQVSSSGDAALSCEVDGLDQQKLYFYHWQWKFHDKVIEENKKYKVFYNYQAPNTCQRSRGSVTLHIRNVSKEDLGQYMCVLQLSNITIAEKEIPFYDFVNPKVPSPPTIVSSEAINCGRAIKVEWSPPVPVKSAISPITEYEIKLETPRDDFKQTFNLSSEERSYKFVGLMINAVYEVSLRAKNSEGLSLPAKQQLKTTADVPKELKVIATPFGCSVKLSWNTPSVNSCPVTQYTIHYRDSMIAASDAGVWQITSLNKSNTNEYRLWLNCSMEYDVMVMAWNQRGHNDFNDKSVLSVLTDTGVQFKPLLTEVKTEQCGAFEVIWEPSTEDSGGGPVTGFHAQLRKRGDDWHHCTNFPTNRSCLFKDLLSETDYDIRIQAVNQKGSSNWTTETVTTGVIGPPDSPVILNNQSELTGRNVTVTWARPGDKYCNITMYSIHYRAIEPITEKWKDINITDTNVTSYELHLQYSKKYTVIVFAWNNLGRSVGSNPWEVRTAQDVPYQPILHETILAECNSVNISWSPPTRPALGDPVTNYLAQIRRTGSKNPWINCTTFNILNSTSCLFTHLKKYTEYEVRVMAGNKLGYSLPSVVVKVSTKEADRSGRPEIVDRKVSGCNVTLKWTAPLPNGCPILVYTVSYRQKETTRGAKIWTVMNITDPTANQQELRLNCSTTYEFQVKAWNELGGGVPSIVQSATTESATTQDDTEGLSTSGSSLVSNIPITVLLVFFFLAFVVVLLVIGVRHCRKRGENKPKRTAKDIQPLEKCEIHPIRTEFVEELGEGAFGKVHKATLKDGFEFFQNNIGFVGKTKQKKIVAVKELHENANEDQRREFLNEIELMKKVGKHQNVLSFLGCWTTTKPLLLIIEYVAHGDLLHWLRRKRSQIKSSASDVKDKDLYAGSRKHITATVDQANGANESSTNLLDDNVHSSSAYDKKEVPSLDECTTPLVAFAVSQQKEDAPTEKQGDECSEDCESFHPADLMSFAWQIARGMNYLSEKGFVHRDLAARNVLVGHGKLLKIADFGLMREVYHEVYEVEKQKKLPVKWMAPESLYKQIFTSKSDVWSYGVVMWEIATVGGTPYPLLGNAELMRRLKTGYRMEKPDMCSDNFYAMMLDCWKQDRDERPSFQELLERLEQLMLQEVDYFDFNKVDESKDYYHVQEKETGENDSDGDTCHILITKL